MHNEKKPTPEVPQTGDSSHAALWLALLGLSGIGAVSVLLMRKRKNKRQGGGRIGRPPWTEKHFLMRTDNSRRVFINMLSGYCLFECFTTT